MNSSVSERYSEVEDEGIAALYEVLTDHIEGKSSISTQNVPDEVHLDALDAVLESNQFPKKSYRMKSSGDVKQLLDHGEHDSRKLAEDYLGAVKDIDYSTNQRIEHDRKIDALIDHYLEREGIEDFDVMLRETFIDDQSFVPYSKREEYEDLDLSQAGTAINSESRPVTDADFWMVDLDSEKILVQEEKSSDSYEQRKDRQLNSIRRTVKKVNEQLGTNYEVETQPMPNHNLTETVDPMPEVYEGNIHVADSAQNKSERMEEFREFMGYFLHNQEYTDLDPLTNTTPEYGKVL